MREPFVSFSSNFPKSLFYHANAGDLIMRMLEPSVYNILSYCVIFLPYLIRML